MSHREKSLTPWITAHGIEKVVLPQSVYDAAVAQDCDMRYFIRQEMLPTDYEVSHGQIHIIEHTMPSSAQRREMIKATLDAGLPLGASHAPEFKSDVFINGSLNGDQPYAPVRNDVVTDKPAPEPMTNTAAQGYAKLEPSYKPRWPCRGDRKSRDSVSCHDCMPGLGGRCTCCVDKE